MNGGLLISFASAHLIQVFKVRFCGWSDNSFTKKIETRQQILTTEIRFDCLHKILVNQYHHFPNLFKHSMRPTLRRKRIFSFVFSFFFSALTIKSNGVLIINYRWPPHNNLFEFAMAFHSVFRYSIAQTTKCRVKRPSLEE